jgi:hypothetical protein
LASGVELSRRALLDLGDECDRGASRLVGTELVLRGLKPFFTAYDLLCELERCV